MRLLGFVMILAGCAAEEQRTKPTPPDMSALVAAYAAPSRTFDEQAAVEIQQRVEQEVRELGDASGIIDAIEAAIAALGEEPQARLAPGRAPIVLEGEGFAKVTRVCSGHGAPPPPVDKDANGFVELTVGYTQQGLDPVVFGNAVGCKEQLAGSALDLAGEVHLFIGNNLQVDQLPDTPIMFELAGFSLAADGTPVLSETGFDFQVCRGAATTCVPGSFELLIGLPGDASLVFFIDLATKSGGFRAANGKWECDFVAGTCSDGVTTITIPVYQL